VDGVSNLCFSPSDTIIAGGTPYGYITLFDVKNNKGLSRFRPLQEEVMDLTFSDDGKHLFVITQSTVFMYDVSDLRYPKSKAMFYMQGNQFMIVLPSGYYMSSKSFISPIAFRNGNRAFPFRSVRP
jgi:WD40 repeat protein